MTVENISWSISTKECCRPWRGWTRDLLVSSRMAHPTEPPRLATSFVHLFFELELNFTVQSMLLRSCPACRSTYSQFFLDRLSPLKQLIRAQLLKTNDVISKRIIKTLIIKYGIWAYIFAEKCESLLHLQKLLTFFQQKYLWIRYCTYENSTYFDHYWARYANNALNNWFQYFVHLLLPVTDNCPSWITG